MLRFFDRMKGKAAPMVLPKHNYGPFNGSSNDSFSPTHYPDEKMGKLMELIGMAIEAWAKEFQMENLPKRIVFEQALDAIHTMECILCNDDH